MTTKALYIVARNSEMHDVGASAKWRVLVFPGGTEIGLEIRQALAWCKEVELFSAGAPVSNHAPFVFARHFVVPMVDQAGWLETLREVVCTNRVTHIFPAHDDALLALAEHASQLPAKVVTSPIETCRITRSKVATARALEGILPTPILFSKVEEVREFPVFLKPDRGQGSQGVELARDQEELAALHRKDTGRKIFEFLPGREFTVDCFSDREQGLLYASGRERRRIKSGIAMDSALANDSRFTEYARAINSVLKLHGAWFFQTKEDRAGILKVLEVAPRIGGTSALSRARGVNLPLLSLYEAEREPVTIAVGNQKIEIDRALVNRFRSDLSYRVLYIDFDDTLIIRNEVNVELVKLLYQAVNRKIRLVLLTRHAGEINEMLRHYRLEGIFDEVIHLRANEPKADFIREKQAVLIDDSFAERTAVHNRTGIPVFAPSMVEVLFDERR
jgi:carbamoyl-phosphate synthase large subunit